MKATELITHPDGSVYHLHLSPEDIADTIITVGDPQRVNTVSQHFDTIEMRKSYREFVTHTGYIGKKRLSVLSTGIGPDNIDIVINELDALVNIDLKTKEKLPHHKSLQIIRIGTSGCLQKDIPVGAFLKSSHALGLDNLMYFYADYQPCDVELLQKITSLPGMNLVQPYLTRCSPYLFEHLGRDFYQGITITCPGFYAPQGRQVRFRSMLYHKIDAWGFWNYGQWRLTNFEMETAAIYGIAFLGGHEAISLNAIIANRMTGEFSTNPQKDIDKLVIKALDDICSLPSLS